MKYVIDKKIIVTSVITAIATTSLLHNPLKMTPPKLFNMVSPSVVAIKSYSLDRDMFSHGQPKATPFGTGSGFVLLNENKPIIITNGHVLNDAAKVTVSLDDIKEYPVSFATLDDVRDIAIITLDSTEVNPKHLILCKNEPYIGEAVAAIGNPYGLDKSMSTGVVSGIKRNIEGGQNQQAIINMIQTDAAINPGNSGGPLVDIDKGCVLGINTAMISPGVGLAIPAKDIQDSIDVILNDKYRMDIIGIELMPDLLIEDLGIPGLPVITVIPDSIAQQNGIRGTYRDESGMPHFGDVIISVNQKPVKSSKDLKAIINSAPDTMDVVVLRNGEKVNIKLTMKK